MRTRSDSFPLSSQFTVCKPHSVISKRTPQPEEVHRSAAVDLGDIVLQAASALRANRGIVRTKPIREPVVRRDEGRRGDDDVIADSRPAFGAKGASQRRFNSTGHKMRSENASTLDATKRSTGKSWQKAAPDPEKLTAQHAYLRAIALLCGRDYSSKKMTEKLAKLSFVADVVSETLVRLRLEGALSDTRFAASRTNGLINRGKGPRAIQAKLKEAGLAKEMITQAIDALEIDWTERARTLLDRKFGDAPPIDHKEWAKRARFLIARGFDESNIRSAMKSEKS